MITTALTGYTFSNVKKFVRSNDICRSRRARYQLCFKTGLKSRINLFLRKLKYKFINLILLNKYISIGFSFRLNVSNNREVLVLTAVKLI